MDPLKEKYCVFSSNPDEIVTLGNFQLKWTVTPDTNYQNYESVRHYVKYKTGDWIESERSTYRYIGYHGANQDPNDLYYGKALSVSMTGCLRQLFYDGKLIYRAKRNDVLFKEFEREVNKDFAKWKKLRKALKEKSLKKEASSEGISLQEKYDQMRLRAKAENTIQLTNLKIEALQEIEKFKSKLEEAANKIEAGTFTASDASDIRWLGKNLGGTGLGPTLRKIASLSKKL